MKLLLLSSQDQLKTFKRSGLQRAVRTALERSAAKKTSRIPRLVLSHTDQAKMGFMPAFAPEEDLFGYKLVAVTPENSERGLNPHQGLVCLFDGKSGRVRALLEASTLTALRTAAASAAATDVLALPDSKVMAVIGTGVQAREHLMSLLEVRPIREIRVYGRTSRSVDGLLEYVDERLPAAPRIVIASSVLEAVRGAQIVSMCTASREPYLQCGDLDPGTHVNAIGACRPGFSEIELQRRPDLRVFVDSEIACLEEATELASSIPIAGEIGRCFSGEIVGRENASQITLFKSVGTGVTDVFAADYLVKQCRAMGVGAEVGFT